MVQRAQNYGENEIPSNSEPTIDALKNQKVFEYRQKEKRDSYRDTLDLQNVTDFMKD